MLNRSRCVDALRLSDAQHDFLMEEMENGSAPRAGAEQRQSTRYRYVAREGLVVELDGATSRYVLRPRNLSATGISLLHGGFLYPGTGCRVLLPTLDGQEVFVPGRIVRCRSVHGRIHEVGVQFGMPIEIDMFIDTQEARVKEAPAVPPEAAVEYDHALVAALTRELYQFAADARPRTDLIRLLGRVLEALRGTPAVDS